MVEHQTQLDATLDKHAEVFNDEYGCFCGPPVKLLMHEDARPKFFKPRAVPLLLKDKVQKELEVLEAQGIISPVQSSEWATPVVPVLKKSGKVRLCGDYKVTVNQAAPTEAYPLPRIEELYAKLSGGKLFTKLDLANAY